MFVYLNSNRLHNVHIFHYSIRPYILNNHFNLLQCSLKSAKQRGFKLNSNFATVWRDRGGRMVVEFTTTYVYAVSAYHHWFCEFEFRSIQHYVIKFVSDLWQVGGFLGEITLDGLIILDIQLLTRPPVYIITYKDQRENVQIIVNRVYSKGYKDVG